VRNAYAIRSGRNFGRDWSLSVQPHIARPEAGIAPNSYNNEARMKFTIVNSEAERREGLKALLRHIDRRARFNEAKDWRQAASAILRLDPDMIVIDWHDAMRMVDLRTLLNAFPKIPAAVIVDEASTAQVRQLLDAGALGVVPRNLDPTLIVRALEMVLLGGHYVPARALVPALEPVFVPRRDVEPKEFRKGSKRFNTLSLRQQQIMRCVRMGSTNKIIAKTLGISEGTVKIHLGSIFQQLGAPNRAAAVAIYNGWQNGYLEVLKREADASPRPALGDAGPLPLRATALLTYAPLPEIEEHLLPMAAEPQPRFGD
jgi:DNA-binding NarL/FixJ family response regulator